MRAYTEEELYAMSNFQLRTLYSRIRIRQKRFSKFPVFLAVPAFLFYFFMGWELLKRLDNSMIERLFDCSLTGGLEFIFFGICAVMLTSNEPNFLVAIPFVFIVAVGLKYIAFGTYGFISAAMLVYLIIASFILCADAKTLRSMRGMSSFPFRPSMD